ncbi:hypothetical protein ABT071_21680 [Streptomyces sp. NPDC002506]|uniref:hypothetical protein n=1 Tax=Streptomyces sp. NPDC002506 TaxID=3154536 RepID=UPI0033303481
MKITISIDQPTGDFQKRLLELLADHAANIEIDTTWSVARAESYYRSLPARARKIVREAAIRDGYVPAEALRENEDSSLRGHSAALSRALRRGFMRGLWPEDMRPPIEAQGPGFGKVVGYRMPDDLVSTFYTAIARTETSGDLIDAKDINAASDSVQALTDVMNMAPKRS